MRLNLQAAIQNQASQETGQVSAEVMIQVGKQSASTGEKISILFKTILTFLCQGYQAAKEMRRSFFKEKSVALIFNTNLQLLAGKVDHVRKAPLHAYLKTFSSSGVVIHATTPHYEFIRSCNQSYEIVNQARGNSSHWLKHFEGELGLNFEKFSPFSNNGQLDFILKFDQFFGSHPELKDLLATLPKGSFVPSALLAKPLTPEILRGRFDNLKLFQDGKEKPRTLEITREFACAFGLTGKELNKEKKAIEKLVKFCNDKLYSPQLLAAALRELFEKEDQSVFVFAEKCDAFFSNKMIEPMNLICSRLHEEKLAEERRIQESSLDMLQAIKKDPFAVVYHFIPRFIQNLLSDEDKDKVSDIEIGLKSLESLFNQSHLIKEGVDYLSKLVNLIPKGLDSNEAKEFLVKQIDGFNKLNLDEIAKLNNRNKFRQELDKHDLGLWQTATEILSDKLFDARQKSIELPKESKEEFLVNCIQTTLPKLVEDRKSIMGWIKRIPTLLPLIRSIGGGWIVNKVMTQFVSSKLEKIDSLDANTKELIKESLKPIIQTLLLAAPAIVERHKLDHYFDFFERLNTLLQKEELNDTQLFMEVMKGMQLLTTDLASYGPDLEEAMSYTKMNIAQ